MSVSSNHKQNTLSQKGRNACVIVNVDGNEKTAKINKKADDLAHLFFF